GNLMLSDGHAFMNVAFHNTAPEFVELYGNVSFVPDPSGPVARLGVTKQPVHVTDLQAGKAYKEGASGAVAMVERAGARSLILVPMLKDDQLLGAIGIYRQEVRPFTDKQVALVSSFAKQAVIAIENVRLLNELRDRTTDLARSVEELHALGDVSQAVNSTLDLKTVLDTIVAKAVQLSGTEAGTIYEFDDQQQELLMRST